MLSLIGSSCSSLGWLLVPLLICLLLLAIVLLLSVRVAAGVWVVSVPAVLVCGAILLLRLSVGIVLATIDLLTLLVWVNGRSSWPSGGLHRSGLRWSPGCGGSDSGGDRARWRSYGRRRGDWLRILLKTEFVQVKLRPGQVSFVLERQVF